MCVERFQPYVLEEYVADSLVERRKIYVNLGGVWCVLVCARSTLLSFAGRGHVAGVCYYLLRGEDTWHVT